MNGSGNWGPFKPAAVVRMIAEQMRAGGLRVWFAEYDVLLKDRERFREAIETAVGGCRFGVCFTKGLLKNKVGNYVGRIS